MALTSTDQIPAFTGAELAAAGRRLSFPATVRLSLENGERIEVCCEAAFRVLPARRIVARAVRDDGQPLVAKLFLGKHAARDAAAELEGLSLARDVGLNVPAVTAGGQLDESGRGLLLELLGGAQRVDVSHIGELATALAALHRDNLVCIDPHFGNFLVSRGRVWMVDGGAIVRRGTLSEAQRIANLALLLAQCPVLPTPALAVAWSNYAGVFYGDESLLPPHNLSE